MLRVAGTLRACWSIGLVFIGPGTSGLVLVIVVELALITSVGVFNPVYSTFRLQHTADSSVARMLSAWSITANLTKAATTAVWGVLALLPSTRTAIGIAGALLVVTPLLLFSFDADRFDADRFDADPAGPRSPEPRSQRQPDASPSA